VQDAAWRQVVPATPEPLPLPDKPSIAVLPFQNMSPDTEHEFFADGIAEDVITALSRYPSLFVIARNSSFTYKGRAVDVKQIGRELGVRYVLEGSLRKGPDVINQDVTCRFGLYESVATGGDREIGGDAAQLGLWCRSSQSSDGFINSTLLEPVNNDGCTASNKALCDGQADSAGRASDDGCLARKIDLHRNGLLTMRGLGTKRSIMQVASVEQ
jgi:hypothetical protein